MVGQSEVGRYVTELRAGIVALALSPTTSTVHIRTSILNGKKVCVSSRNTVFLWNNKGTWSCWVRFSQNRDSWVVQVKSQHYCHVMKCHICSHIYIIETLSGAYAGILKGGFYFINAREARAIFLAPPTFGVTMPTFIPFMAIVTINMVSGRPPVCVIWKSRW